MHMIEILAMFELTARTTILVKYIYIHFHRVSTILQSTGPSNKIKTLIKTMYGCPRHPLLDQR